MGWGSGVGTSLSAEPCGPTPCAGAIGSAAIILFAKTCALCLNRAELAAESRHGWTKPPERVQPQRAQLRKLLRFQIIFGRHATELSTSMLAGLRAPAPHLLRQWKAPIPCHLHGAQLRYRQARRGVQQMGAIMGDQAVLPAFSSRWVTLTGGGGGGVHIDAWHTAMHRYTARQRPDASSLQWPNPATYMYRGQERTATSQQSPVPLGAAPLCLHVEHALRCGRAQCSPPKLNPAPSNPNGKHIPHLKLSLLQQ